MINWISENLGTLVIGLGVLIVAALAARSVYRNKKRGGCAYGCPGCTKDSCHDSPHDK